MVGPAGRSLACGIGGIGRSKAKVTDAERPATRFSDVAGYEGAKQEIAEVIDFLRSPDRYAKAGAIGPRGVLMVGPPGTGKTLLARAVAGEADVPFLSISGSGFVELFVGVGASRVRDLFAGSPKALAGHHLHRRDRRHRRSAQRGRTGYERRTGADAEPVAARRWTVSTRQAGVVVLAATNRPETLDPALLRPGRFDRQVVVPLPNVKEREQILAVHGRGKQLGPDLDLSVVARGTPGFSGADLANLLNEAAIAAVRGNRDVITAHDVDEARDRILLGRREASNALLPEERRSVAIHESGHALVAAFSSHADPVAKVTILPARDGARRDRATARGRAPHLHRGISDRHARGTAGGACRRARHFGEGSTGASNDLAGATQLATRMVVEFGLSPALGPVSYSTGQPAVPRPGTGRPR